MSADNTSASQEEDKATGQEKPDSTLLAKSDEEYIAIGTKPLNGTDPLVYSIDKVISPFSFVDPTKRKYNPEVPPPIYLTTEELKYDLHYTKADMLTGYAESAEGGVECVDKKIYEKQKGVVMNLLKQAVKGVFVKDGFVRISLPVRVFEGRSTLDRILDGWRMAPTFLPKAAACTDPIARMKWVITFAISGIYCMLTHLKPFNPILGETLEGGFDDGTKIYCEHTSHHPAITNFYMIGANDLYTMHGKYQYKMEFSANSFKLRQAGYHHIVFKDGGVVSFKLPFAKFSGMVMGTRIVYFTGEMKFIDKANALKAVVLFDSGKTEGMFASRKKGCKRDQFEGILYRWDTMADKQKKVKKLKELKDIESPICQITGSWLHNIKFGEETYWTIDEVMPTGIWYAARVLPSDWRFREDLLWIRKENETIADLWKKELEVQQRFDRSLREKAQKEEKAKEEKAKKAK